MLYLRTTPRQENLLFLQYRTTEGMEVIKGLEEGRRKRQVISWAERGSSSFLDCVVAVSG
jgi:hypothetical protein